jgi:hypothetical protein
MDAECNWKGEMTTADLTCTLSNSILGEQESVTTAIAQSTYEARSRTLIKQ